MVNQQTRGIKMKTVWVALTSCVLAACASNASSSAGGNSSLVGSWRLTAVGNQTIAMTTGSPKMLAFEAGSNKISGNVGCNRLLGIYENDGSSLRFNGVAATRMACDPATMQTEQQVIQSLENVQSWQINGKELQLRDDKQQTILKFQRM